jgi:hypothetical protein
VILNNRAGRCIVDHGLQYMYIIYQVVYK